MLADLEGEIRRVAGFLGIEAPGAAMPSILRNCTLAEMRADAARAGRFEGTFKDGAADFFYKGTNGRWREVLGKEELALYDQATKRELTPDCRQWLENGRPSSRGST